MDWWTLAKPYVEAPVNVVGFTLTVGNIGWLIHQARKAKAEDKKRTAEDKRRAEIENELNLIVQAFVRSPTHVRIIEHGKADLHMAAAVLGLSRGVLRGFWADGKLHVVMAAVDGDAAEERARMMLRQFRAESEAQLPVVLNLVAQHGEEFVEVPLGLRLGAHLASDRKLVRLQVEKDGRVYVSAPPSGT